MEQIEVAYLPLWRRYHALFRKGRLTLEEIGQLVMAMMEYQFDGTVTHELPEELEVFWLFIEPDLDHARQKYEQAVKNGRKGGRRKKQDETDELMEEPEGIQQNQTEPDKTQQNRTEPDKTQQNRTEPDKTQQNRMEGISISESRSISESISESRSTTQSSSGRKKGQYHPGPASAGESVCLEKKNFGEFGWIRMTEEQYRNLEQLMGRDVLAQCIQYIDESAQCTNNRNNWFDWYSVLRRCYRERWYEKRSRYPQKEEIPKGASGHLGEAEMEAIQWILQQPD